MLSHGRASLQDNDSGTGQKYPTFQTSLHAHMHKDHPLLLAPFHVGWCGTTRNCALWDESAEWPVARRRRLQLALHMTPAGLSPMDAADISTST